jgi:SlyX protein
MSERLTELEIRYMQQERTLQELGDAIFRQEKVIRRLENEVRQLRDQLRETTPSMLRDSDDEEPPPHY